MSFLWLFAFIYKSLKMHTHWVDWGNVLRMNLTIFDLHLETQAHYGVKFAFLSLSSRTWTILQKIPVVKKFSWPGISVMLLTWRNCLFHLKYHSIGRISFLLRRCTDLRKNLDFCFFTFFLQRVKSESIKKYFIRFFICLVALKDDLYLKLN
jgi:hypothetical protein